MPAVPKNAGQRQLQRRSRSGERSHVRLVWAKMIKEQKGTWNKSCTGSATTEEEISKMSEDMKEQGKKDEEIKHDVIKCPRRINK